MAWNSLGTKRNNAERLRSGLARWLWLVVVVCALGLGYLMVWKRGLFSDDYNHWRMAIDWMTGCIRPLLSRDRLPTYPTRILTCIVCTTLSGMVPSQELLARVSEALMAGVNALLLGWLAYRIWRSRLAAIVSGALLLMPILAQEPVLWISAAGYLFAACFALLFVHACLSAMQQPARWWLWVALSVLAFAAMLQSLEADLLAAGLVPLLALVVASREVRPRYGVALGRSVLMLVGPAAVGAIFYLTCYRGTWVMDMRGGLDLSPAGLWARSVFFVQRTLWMTVAFRGGQQYAKDALSLGLETLRTSWIWLAVAALFGLSALGAVLTWRRDPSPSRDRLWLVLVVFLPINGVLLLASLLFPSVLTAGQWPAYRLFYFPVVLGSLFVGTLAYVVVRLLRRFWVEKLIVALVTVILFASSLCMAGYARVYAARYERDQRQLQTLVANAPAQYLPPQAYLVLYNTEEPLIPGRASLDGYLRGAWEGSWSSGPSIRPAYRRPDLQVIDSHRWGSMSFQYVAGTSDREAKLLVRGAAIQDGTQTPVAKTLLITCRNTMAVAVRELTLVSADGTKQVIQFPLAQELDRHGFATIDLTVNV
jgi:hypothetical protein